MNTTIYRYITREGEGRVKKKKGTYYIERERKNLSGLRECEYEVGKNVDMICGACRI
jgi:hypothetical protein